MFSPGQMKALFITPMIGGTISTVSSGTIIFMILRSEIKLSVPPRRIFFGLCVYDCFFSLGAALSSFPVPKEEGILGAAGNITTCDFQGFINHIGVIGSMFYNCSLSIYYFCIIGLSMAEATFTKKVEPFCHLIPNLYGFGGALYLLIHRDFNNIGNSCWVGPSPINCITDSDVECLRGENAYNNRWIFMGYSVYFIWFVIIVNMTSILHKVAKQRQSADRWATGSTVENCALCQSLLQKSLKLFTGRAHDSSSQKIAEIELKPTPNDDHVSNLRSPRRSSFRVLQGQEDPLVFNLRAMRARTKRSLIVKKEDAASIDGEVRSLQSDPHPFDVKTARYSFSKGGSYKNVSRSQSINRPPPLLDLDEEFQSQRTITISETNQLRSKKRRSTETIGDGDDSIASGRRNSISFACEDASSAPTMRGHSLGNAQHVVATQGLLYICSFFLCFVWSVAMRMLENNGKMIPFVLYFIARVMLPLQGLFNIIIYSRPFVLCLRRSHPEYSLWKAFRITVANGGDNLTNSVRLDSFSVSKKIRDKIEQNNLERMQSIRQTRRGSMFNSTTSSTPLNVDSRRLSSVSSLPNDYDETSNKRDLLNVEACSSINSQDDVRVIKSADNAPESLSWDKDSPAEQDSFSRKDNNGVLVVGALDPTASEYSNVDADSVQLDSSKKIQGILSKTTEKKVTELTISANDEPIHESSGSAQTMDESSSHIGNLKADDKSDIEVDL